MRPRLRRARWQFSTFAAVGVGNTIVDTAVFAALVTLLGWRSGTTALAASSIGFAAGALHSYAWNSRHTFAAAGHGGGPRVALRFAITVASGMAVSAAVFASMNAAIGSQYLGLVLAKALSIVATVLWDFTLARYWVFRPLPREAYEASTHHLSAETETGTPIAPHQ